VRMKRFIFPAAIFLRPCSAFCCVLLLASIFPLAAQKVAPRKPFDTDMATLRSRFTEAVGQDFEIVKDEIKQRSNARGGGRYWLVHLKPKHSGYFALTYRYDYSDSHYSHVEREFNLGVGARGCRRGPPHLGSYHRFCIGDTIIVPIVINNFKRHEFSLKSSLYSEKDDAAYETHLAKPATQDSQRSLLNNPLADQMRYVGSTSHKLLHRNGGYTLEAYAEFEAQRPGRFNLALSSAHSGLPASVFSDAGHSGSIPIIIVARETPVTLLASSHAVRGYTMGYDGREFVSSTSGDSYMTELIILQPGDRISLKYHSHVRSRDYERTERASHLQSDIARDEVPPPLIIKRPFGLRSEYNFTEWLVDYLPD